MSASWPGLWCSHQAKKRLTACRYADPRVPIVDGSGKEFPEAASGVLTGIGDDRRHDHGCRCRRDGSGGFGGGQLSGRRSRWSRQPPDVGSFAAPRAGVDALRDRTNHRSGPDYKNSICRLKAALLAIDRVAGASPCYSQLREDPQTIGWCTTLMLCPRASTGATHPPSSNRSLDRRCSGRGCALQ